MNRRRVSSWCAALAMLGAILSACAGEAASEIVLVVDTDMAPNTIDTFTILVSGPSAADQETMVPYEGAPRTLGLVAATNVLAPVSISVVGTSSGSTAKVTRLVLTRFDKGVSRVLHIRLSSACLDTTCTGGQTCDASGSCVAADVDPTTLPAYLGTVSVPELCNGVDDDADGRADEDFDLTSDPTHCGACNASCAPGVLCVSSACVDSPVIQVAAGSTHTCVLRAGGGVACWGDNTFGELGDGTKTQRRRPVSVSKVTDAVSVSTGFGFTCAARRDQSVSCWGSNTCGELGQPGAISESVLPLAVPTVSGAVEISGGNCHNCARLSSGSVYCWGQNTEGQIGNGVMLSDPAAPPTLVMALANATSVRVGSDHSCALRADGSVSCWGANAGRQLGDGTESSRGVPTRVVGLPDLTDARMRATAVAAGTDFSCVLTTLGARCWGSNGTLQLGLPMGVMWDGVAPTTVPGTRDATALSIGALGCFGCVLGAGGVVSCWGCNGEGQLANASTLPSDSAAPAAGVPAATAISVGKAHACALTAGGDVWCWGSNSNGQLGIGSGLPSSPPAQVTGL